MAIVLEMVMDAKNVQAAIKATKHGFKQLDSQFNRLNKKFKTLKMPKLRVFGLASITQGFRQLFDSVVRFSTVAAASFLDVNSTLEQMQIMMETATGSIEGGKQALEDMLRLSVEAPFSIDSLANSFVKLRTAGLDPMDGTLQTLVDSVAAFGGSSEQLRLVSIAMQQMVGKGVISMEELRRQFGEQVPTAMRAMASELEMSVFDMLDLIGKGGLLSEKGVPALIEGLRKLHTGAARKRMDSFEGALITLRNQWTRLMKAIGDGEGAFDAVSDAVRSAAKGLENLRTSAANSETLQNLSEALTKSMEKFSDPQIFEIMAQNVVKFANVAVSALGMVGDSLKWLMASFDQLSGAVNEHSLRMLGIDPGKIDSKNYIQVRDLLIDITRLQNEVTTIPAAQMFGSMEELVSRFGEETATTIAELIQKKVELQQALGESIKFGKPDTVQYEAAMKAVLKANKKSVEGFFDETDKMFRMMEGAAQEVDLATALAAESEKAGAAMLENFADNFEKIEKRAEELKESIAKQMNEMAMLQLEFAKDRADVAFGGNDLMAYKMDLALIEEYGRKADEAFKTGNIKLYNDLLDEQYQLIKRLDDQGITEDIEERKIKKQIEAQKKLIKQLKEIRDSRPQFSHKNTYQREVDEAKRKLAQLYIVQKEGTREIISADEQRKTKLDLMLQAQEKITTAKQDSIDKDKDILENIETRKEAIKELEEAVNGESAAVDDLTLVWDKHTQQFLYAGEQRRQEIERQIQLIKNLNSAIAGTDISSWNSTYDLDNTPGRYSGGPVTASQPYIVGEKGPELFVPSNNGQIIPNNELSSGQSTEIVLNFNGNKVGPMFSTKQVAREVLREFERMQGALS